MGTVYIYSFFCDFTSEKFEKHNKFSIEYINGRSKTSIEIKKKNQLSYVSHLLLKYSKKTTKQNKAE